MSEQHRENGYTFEETPFAYALKDEVWFLLLDRSIYSETEREL